MRIVIDTSSSYEAKVTISGDEDSPSDSRTLTFRAVPKEGMWKYVEGFNEQDFTYTIGGMVAQKLIRVMPDILQAWLPENESPDNDCWRIWERMDRATARDVARIMEVL